MAAQSLGFKISLGALIGRVSRVPRFLCAPNFFFFYCRRGFFSVMISLLKNYARFLNLPEDNPAQANSPPPPSDGASTPPQTGSPPPAGAGPRSPVSLFKTQEFLAEVYADTQVGGLGNGAGGTEEIETFHEGWKRCPATRMPPLSVALRQPVRDL